MKIQIITSALLLILLSLNASGIGKRDISFSNGEVTLRGTMYIPKGDGPFPAVVFVHGSGPENRDNSKYSAKWLASIGYVALAYDKRGSGESDGEETEWKRFSIDTLAEDVVAAVQFLSNQKEVDNTKIGIHASSQGGWVASAAATKTDQISFMIIRSASVCSIGEDRIFERTARLEKEGFSATDLKEAQAMQRVEPKTTEDDDAPDQFTKLYDQYKERAWLPRVYGGSNPFSTSLIAYRKWYATVVNVDAVRNLKQVDMPIFWIFGDPMLDKKGPVEQSIEAVNRLQASGKAYTIYSFEGEGHNVKERKYELALYQWLVDIHGSARFKFRKH